MGACPGVGSGSGSGSGRFGGRLLLLLERWGGEAVRCTVDGTAKRKSNKNKQQQNEIKQS